MKRWGERGVIGVCVALTGVVLLAGCRADSSTVTTSTVTVTKDPSATSTGTSPAPPGTSTSRDFPVSDFAAVRLAAHYDVTVTVGSPTSVRAEGDPAALDLLDIKTEGDTLVAAVEPNSQWPPNSRVTVSVTTPTLNAAEVDGSGDMRIGTVRTDTLSLTQGGSGDMEVREIAVKQLRVSSRGSGDVNASGTADDADIRLDGSGEADLQELTVKRAQIAVSGSGGLEIKATEKVSGSLSGSADVDVTGGAACSVSKSGSGEVSCG